jgi:hypothetical protein
MVAYTDGHERVYDFSKQAFVWVNLRISIWKVFDWNVALTSDTPTEVLYGFAYFLDPDAGRVTQSGLIDITTNSNISFANHSTFDAADLKTPVAS